MMRNRSILATVLLCVALAGAVQAGERGQVQAVVERYCSNCHDKDEPDGGLDLTSIASQDVTAHSDAWEKVVRRLRARQMPPAGKKRPDEQTYVAVQSELEAALDAEAARHPRPGRTDTIRRLTRTEYQNAVRNLLALDIDAAAMLPADEASHGFDNVTVGNLSPTLLDRYVTAAQKIARLAVGSPLRVPGGDTFRVKPDITQEERIEGLPVGTRGGTLIHYTFPRDGTYEVQVRLARDRNEQVEGLHEEHELEVLLDKGQVQSFTVKPPRNNDHEHVDTHLKARFDVKAGPHDLGVTFLKNPSSLVETLRQPYNAHFNFHRHPRLTPAVYQVSITGPFDDQGAGDTPSRRRIFVTKPKSPKDEDAAARQILSTLMRRAYRRPVGDGDIERILPFYRDARQDGGDFDAGIESALSAMLVSREFLFRVERDPPGVASNTAYNVSDVELASRLSFFLWSSIPDDELLSAAERGRLHDPEELARQTRRMLADPRSQSLVTNFAAQWLHLRNLDSITPDGRLFPDFDDNLRQAFRRETELLFEEVIRGDITVLALIKSDHTYVNERLAKHYGVPHVYGTDFRHVALDRDTPRGGLLRQGSILTVTSYATRTSPVLRGKWILDNLMATPPPPQPPNVPALVENTVNASLPIRERLAAHRANAACASCHKLMDPVGFSLENYDAVGRWRSLDDGRPVDAAGGFPDGSTFDGPDGLEASLLARPEIFINTLAEKLLTYTLGRGVEPSDGPALREVLRKGKAADYRFSDLVVALVASPPFRMRTTP
jgi:hypothetical protein